MKQVIRGGCWNDYASGLQSAARADYYPNNTNHYCGFRLARVRRRCLLRGGYWFNYASNLRSAYRHSIFPSDTNNSCGFRLVKEEI